MEICVKERAIHIRSSILAALSRLFVYGDTVDFVVRSRVMGFVPYHNCQRYYVPYFVDREVVLGRLFTTRLSKVSSASKAYPRT